MDVDEMLHVDRCWDMDELINFNPDAGTGLLYPISYKRCYAGFYVGKIPRIRIGDPPLQRGVVLQWFYSLSHRNT